MAKIYAVGVGPGDPELLTRKAERILREVPVICAPTANPADSSYALSIVEPFLDRNRQEVIVQVFPMRKNQTGLEEFWQLSRASGARPRSPVELSAADMQWFGLTAEASRERSAEAGSQPESP